MNDLHARLVETVTAHLRIAEAAALDWPSVVGIVEGDPPFIAPDRAVEHIAANDPAHVIRACEADLARLARHIPHVEGPTTPPQLVGLCQCCGKPFPCWYYRIETSTIARVYQVD